MNEEKKAAILEKIKKLQRHQEGAEKIGSIEEAATAAAKLSALMLKYNIELHELLDPSEQVKTFKHKFDFAVYWKRNESHWLFTLMGTISKYSQCSVVGHHVQGAAKSPYTCTIYGDKQNLNTVLYLFDSLHTQIRNLENEAWKSYQGYNKRNAFRRGYFQGANAGLWGRFKELQEEVVQEHGESALVYIGNAMTLAKDARDKEYPSLKSTTTRTANKGLSGLGQGYKDSSKLSINKGNLNSNVQSRRIG